MIPIDPAIILALGIIFTTLSVTERVLARLNEKGVLKKLYAKVHRKKQSIEASLKENKSLLENDDFRDLLNSARDEIRNHVTDDIIDIAKETISLTSISEFLR